MSNKIGFYNSNKNNYWVKIMFLHIINYTVRAAIIIIGITLLTDILLPENANTSFIKIMGVIFILFGTYRIITYYSHTRRYKSLKIRGDENDDL
jgi:hypothetical protein